MLKEFVRNGDFESGRTAFQSGYHRLVGDPGTRETRAGAYDVAADPSKVAFSWPDWASFGDHTSGSGLMLVVDGTEGDFWHQTVNLAKGHDYTFSLWARSADSGSGGVGDPSVISFYADGHAIGGSLTLSVTADDGWQQLTFEFTPTTAVHQVSLADANTDSSYNDFAVDDISITHQTRDPAPVAVQPPAAHAAAHGIVALPQAFGPDTAVEAGLWHPAGHADPIAHPALA